MSDDLPLLSQVRDALISNDFRYRYESNPADPYSRYEHLTKRISVDVSYPYREDGDLRPRSVTHLRFIFRSGLRADGDEITGRVDVGSWPLSTLEELIRGFVTAHADR